MNKMSSRHGGQNVKLDDGSLVAGGVGLSPGSQEGSCSPDPLEGCCFGHLRSLVNLFLFCEGTSSVSSVFLPFHGV